MFARNATSREEQNYCAQEGGPVVGGLTEAARWRWPRRGRDGTFGPALSVRFVIATPVSAGSATPPPSDTCALARENTPKLGSLHAR